MTASREKIDSFNLALLQESVLNISNRANETHKFMTETLPKQMEGVAELAALRALREHEKECPAREAFPGMAARVAEDSKVVDLLASGRELTSKQRRDRARSSGGTVSISPNGVRVKLPAWIWKTAIGMIIAAALSAFGYTVKSDVVADAEPGDTDARPAVTSRP